MMKRVPYIFCMILHLAAALEPDDPIPRWGQATVLVNSALYIQGGRTDPFNTYGYSSAPTNNDLLRLTLSAPFTTTSPPWQLLLNSSAPGSTQGPAVSWHTMSACNASHILLFGGQPGPNSQPVLVDLADSAYFLDISNQIQPLWISEYASWADEPVRRIHHSSISDASGRVYIIGGEKADGSGNVFSQHYFFQSSSSSFTPLPTANGPPGISGHASVILPDGRLLVFGGYSQSTSSLFPLSVVWVLNTKQSPLSWTSVSVSNTTLPAPRASFAASTLDDSNVLIHGGFDGQQNNFADGWILNTSQVPMVWAQIETLSQLGARRDHFAISLGNQVLFGFGYGDTSPAPSSLQIYDFVRDAFVTTFTPQLPPATGVTASNAPNPTESLGGSATSSLDPSDPETPSGGHSKTRKGDIATISATFSVVAVGIIVLGVFLYVRRGKPSERGAARFMVLDEVDDGRSSPHFAGGPVPVPYFSVGYDDNRSRWDLRVLTSLSSRVGAIAASRRQAPARRDMLADEDTWEFGILHSRHQTSGSNKSSWSLMSILTRLASREPSSSGSKGEKTDSSTRDEAENPFNVKRARSYLHNKGYSDPFADPIEEEGEGDIQPLEQNTTPISGPYLHPLPQPLRTIRKEPQVNCGVSVSPGRPHQTVLSVHEHPKPISPPAIIKPLQPDDPSSQRASTFSLGPVRLSAGLPSSIVEDQPFSQLMRRGDSWWARFSRTSFLDRKMSDASRVSGGMSEFRDPTQPPRLIPIDEATPASISSTSNDPSSALYGPHSKYNKSKTSVGTADTEAIERMARTTDVQIMRSESSRTGSDVNSLHAYSYAGSLFDHVEGPSLDTTPERSDEMGFRSDPKPPEDLSIANTHEKENRVKSTSSTGLFGTYGLTPRPSLFVANPDHRTSASFS